jgi:translation initiation factor 1A
LSRTGPTLLPLSAAHHSAEYAKVLRMLGNGRLEAYCFDGKTRQCHIRGKMRKKVRRARHRSLLARSREHPLRVGEPPRLHAPHCPGVAPRLIALACLPRPAPRLQVWVGAGDIILVSLRDYQDDKGDVILKYTADEARQLKSVGELPESTVINEASAPGEGGEEGGFVFGDSSDEESGDDVDVDAI